MDQRILGIHHVTAIAGDPQGNVDFYAGVLGLRLVKKTVNFDDPATYHLYYGDEAGNPGTLLTFFPWPGARRGRQGTGQVSVVSLSIPQFSLGYWLERLITHGVRYEGPTRRFDEQVVAFRDPDGLALDLVTDGAVHDRSGWGAGPVPADHAIRGVSSVTLWEEGYELTARLLTETLGFRLIREDGNRFRFGVGSGGSGATVDVVLAPNFWQGVVAVGTVHHVAWRTHDDEEQRRWRETLAERGYNVTPVIDRKYFRAIYFREPGGVLFEISTDPPGFTVDEGLDDLGTRLQLPETLERYRSQLERALPPLHLPMGRGAPRHEKT